MGLNLIKMNLLRRNHLFFCTQIPTKVFHAVTSLQLSFLFNPDVCILLPYRGCCLVTMALTAYFHSNNSTQISFTHLPHRCSEQEEVCVDPE